MRDIQDRITSRLERLDGRPFQQDVWSRPGGGGGQTRVIVEGGVFEKGGVNFSEVHGDLTPEFSRQVLAERERTRAARGEAPRPDVAAAGEGQPTTFYATGLSVVLHPRNPRVPTVHANFRYVEHGSAWWFGGGADLTPYRLYEEDARHFHTTWKTACDRHDREYYARFKKWCDEYFYIAHRGESRGVGGIFFDHLGGDFERLFRFWSDAGGAFLDAYVPIVERRKAEAFTPDEREWQLLRRGRYVEFNLIYDRGTIFGLRTSGRVESILMSLPPLVRWGYHPEPAGGPDEAGGYQSELLAVLRSPREWV